MWRCQQRDQTCPNMFHAYPSDPKSGRKPSDATPGYDPNNKDRRSSWDTGVLMQVVDKLKTKRSALLQATSQDKRQRQMIIDGIFEANSRVPPEWASRECVAGPRATQERVQ